jgi:hypothetical protein
MTVLIVGIHIVYWERSLLFVYVYCLLDVHCVLEFVRCVLVLWVITEGVFRDRGLGLREPFTAAPIPYTY